MLKKRKDLVFEKGLPKPDYMAVDDGPKDGPPPVPSAAAFTDEVTQPGMPRTVRAVVGEERKGREEIIPATSTLKVVEPDAPSSRPTRIGGMSGIVPVPADDPEQMEPADLVGEEGAGLAEE
mgnify:CR=1 FL=1